MQGKIESCDDAGLKPCMYINSYCQSSRQGFLVLIEPLQSPADGPVIVVLLKKTCKRSNGKLAGSDLEQSMVVVVVEQNLTCVRVDAER
jgi:hypothetical protein